MPPRPPALAGPSRAVSGSARTPSSRWLSPAPHRGASAAVRGRVSPWSRTPLHSLPLPSPPAPPTPFPLSRESVAPASCLRSVMRGAREGGETVHGRLSRPGVRDQGDTRPLTAASSVVPATWLRCAPPGRLHSSPGCIAPPHTLAPSFPPASLRSAPPRRSRGFKAGGRGRGGRALPAQVPPASCRRALACGVRVCPTGLY